MQVAPLIDYLRALEERGETHIYLDQEARKHLRELYKEARNAKQNSVSTPLVRQSQAAKPERISSPPSQRLITSVTVPDGGAAEQIAGLKKQAEVWAPARELGTLRDRMVFSVGNPEADLMLVGEAPGFHEERLQEPFVGPAGQKLTAMLKAMGLKREDVYISNIVKFRPATKTQELTPTSNRAPSQQEMNACLPLIEAEVSAVKPKCIVAFGATAGNGLLGGKRAVGALRGEFHRFADIPVRVTYHPSYILRTENSPDEKKAKRAVWEDLLSVMELMGMSISDKQRNYFSSK